MTPDQARHAIKFLGRVPLKGEEAPLFMDILTALAAIANPPPPAPLPTP